MALTLLGLQLQSCNDEDNNGTIVVPAALENAFAEKYPTVNNERWKTRGNYYVADFRLGQGEASAWFTSGGDWQMTETDVVYQQLPPAVKTAFEGSEYGRWTIDDVDLLERPAMETIYVIEVESGELEYDLYYSADGILLKRVVEEDDDSIHYLPAAVPEEVRQFVEQHYPGAMIVDAEVEDGQLEVDILHDRIGKEAVFYLSGKWMFTSWEVALSALPAAVTQAIAQAPEYAGFRPDEADFYETPAGEYYEVELERGESEISVRLTPQGEFVR